MQEQDYSILGWAGRYSNYLDVGVENELFKAVNLFLRESSRVGFFGGCFFNLTRFLYFKLDERIVFLPIFTIFLDFK